MSTLPIVEPGLVDSQALPTVSADAPWPGLASFTENQSTFFHGREQEIRALARLMERKALTVLFGQSGLGKSSLLQAGVFPRLRAAGFCPVNIRLDHAEGAPLPAEQVKAAVRAETARVGVWTQPGAAKPGESLWEFFHHRDDRLIDANGRGIVPVLVFDQFEELFTLGAAHGASSTGGAQRDRAVTFMSELAELVENRPSEQLVARLDESSAEMDAFDFSRADYRVCISLREDFLPHLEGLKTIMPALMENRMRLTRMTGMQALDAVLKPGGALVTDTVARAIVEFVAGARGGSVERLAEIDVEPPLLSVICRELNDRRRALGHPQITPDLVTGNRREILHDFYERSVADLPEPMRRFVEDKLLTKSGFRDNLALETALEEPGVTKPQIDTLIARRLLRIEDRIGAQRVELTHDVLADVVKASRDARQQRLLLEAARAREAEALAAASRRTRRLRWAVAGLAATVVALCAAGVFGLRARHRAFESASRTDASFASRLLEEGNTAEGFAYFVRAAHKDPRNSVIAPRLLSALVTRNFLLPEGAPLVLPAATRGLRYSLDGTRLWIVGDDGVIRVVTASEQRVTAQFTFDQPVAGMMMPASNDRVFMVRFADRSRRMFNSATGEPLTPPMLSDGHAQNTTVLSRDGHWLAVLDDTKIFIWDATTGRQRAAIAYGQRRLGSASFSPDGTRLLTGMAGGFIRQWSCVDGTPIGEETAIPGISPGQSPQGEYSPDGRRFVVCAYSAGGLLFDTETGNKVGPVLAQELCAAAEFSEDGKRLFTYGTIAGAPTVCTWDPATGAPLLPPWTITGGSFESFLSRDGNVLLTTTREGIARVWDTRAGKLLAEPTPPIGRASRGALSPDGAMVAMAAGSSVYFFHVGAGAARPLDLPRIAPIMVAPFLASAPARMLWLGKDGAKVLDVASGREVGGGGHYPRPFVDWPAAGSSIRADAAAMAVLTGEPRALKPDSHWEGWQLEAGMVKRTATLEDAPVGTLPAANWLCFSAAGDLVALTANTAPQTIRVWSVETGKPVAAPMTMDSRLSFTNSRPAAFSPDGKRLAVGVQSGLVRVWDVATGRPVFDLEPAAPSYIRFVSFSPDGERIATGAASGLVRLWDARTGKLIRDPIVLDASLGVLEFSRDGRLLVTGSADDCRLWDGRTGEPVGQPLATGGGYRGIGFNRDGSRIAVALNNGFAKIWDTSTQQQVTEPLAHTGLRVVTAELSPDERFLRTETNNNHYFVWSVPPDAKGAPVPAWLTDLATLCVGKRLTDDGQLKTAIDSLARIDEVRRTLASLPDDAPYVEWGRWFLADRTTRSISPGFTITPAEAEKLARELSAEPSSATPPAPVDPTR